MAGNAHVFRVRLRGHGQQLRQKATLIVNAVTFKLYAEIVGAPEHKVDTGRARAGWAISVSVPEGYVPEKHKRPKGTTGAIFPKPSAQQFLAVIQTAPLEAKRIIYNNVEYIVWIELGTERSDGSHVVALAVQRLLAA